MRNTNKLDSGFQIKNIILAESSFSRIKNVIFEGNIENNLQIHTEVDVNEKVITVAEEAIVVQKFQDMEQVNIKIKMVGVFECIGDSQLTNFEEFGNVNGAAILFPYIREHVTNLSLKAGIDPIILPPVNFTKNV